MDRGLQKHAAKLVAHRGASHDAPENTLAAVELAWQRGADAVEVDVRLSSDGRIVVIHDPTTARTAGVDKRVDEQTFEELRALDAGSWKSSRFRGQKIPAVEEVLATIPAGRMAVIEIKCGPEILEELVRVVCHAELDARQTAFISFKADVVREAKEAFPDSPVLWLRTVGQYVDGWGNPDADSLIAAGQEANLNGLNLQFSDGIDERFIEQIHAAGLWVWVWTVDDPRQGEKLFRAGVDGMTTNRPGRLREQLDLAGS